MLAVLVTTWPATVAVPVTVTARKLGGVAAVVARVSVADSPGLMVVLSNEQIMSAPRVSGQLSCTGTTRPLLLLAVTVRLVEAPGASTTEVTDGTNHTSWVCRVYALGSVVSCIVPDGVSAVACTLNTLSENGKRESIGGETVNGTASGCPFGVTVSVM